MFRSLPHIIATIALSSCLGFTAITPTNRIGWHQLKPCSSLFLPTTCLDARYKGSEDNDDDNEEEEEDDTDDNEDVLFSQKEDWRNFRAKLVMGEKPMVEQRNSTTTTAEDDLDGIGAIFAGQELESTTSSSSGYTASETLCDKMTPLDPSQWAYDSGKVIEQGAVILGGVEQTFGFGLRQQYFHKAAILIVDHEESTFTRAIILNRPTDLTLDDTSNPGVKWRVWFGGDVQNLQSDNPQIICLHSLNEPRVVEASVPIMKDIQWTTFENAQKLVKVGVAKSTDFWVFAGYAGKN